MARGVKCNQVEISAVLLHKRLGHSHASTVHLVATSMNKILKHSNTLDVFNAYQLGKPHRLPMKYAHYGLTIPLEIVHVDL